MSLRIPDLYERFAVYDAKGFAVGHCVRRVRLEAGISFSPANRDLRGQFNEIQEHVALMDCARADQL